MEKERETSTPGRAYGNEPANPGKLNPARRAKALCLVGFAAYWTWVFCALLTNAITPQGPSAVPLDTWLYSTVLHMATLAACAALDARGRLGEGGSRIAAMFAPSACLAGLALIFAASAGFVDVALGVVGGAALGGIGSGLLVIQWARLFCAVCPDGEKQRFLAAGVTIAAACDLALSLAPQSAFAAALAILPLASAIAFACAETLSRQATGGGKAADAQARRGDAPPQEALSGRFVAFCLVFPIPLGLFQTWLSADTTALSAWAPMLAPAIALLVVVFAADAMLGARLRFNLAEKLIMPVMVAGLFVLASLDGPSAMLAGMLVFAAQQIMSTVLYARFGIVASKGDVSPVRAFALGIIATDVGFAVGILAGSAMAAAPGHAMTLVLGLAYLMVLVAFFSASAAPWAKAKGDEDTRHPIASSTPERMLDELGDERALTPREREMLDYLLRGKSVPAIAAEVFLSANTVRTHIAHIYQKFDVHSRDELVALIEKERERRA